MDTVLVSLHLILFTKVLETTSNLTLEDIKIIVKVMICLKCKSIQRHKNWAIPVALDKILGHPFLCSQKDLLTVNDNTC